MILIGTDLQHRYGSTTGIDYSTVAFKGVNRLHIAIHDCNNVIIKLTNNCIYQRKYLSR